MFVHGQCMIIKKELRFPDGFCPSRNPKTYPFSWWAMTIKKEFSWWFVSINESKKLSSFLMGSDHQERLFLMVFPHQRIQKTFLEGFCPSTIPKTGNTLFGILFTYFSINKNIFLDVHAHQEKYKTFLMF